MRLLLDECIDERLRHLFYNHDCYSTRYAGLAGLKNGNLLAAAEAAGFDVIVTVDHNMPAQQNWLHRRISLLILRGTTNRLADLKPLISNALVALDSIKPGQVVSIGP